MIRLYMLLDTDNQRYRTSNGEVVYFECKLSAKYRRNRLNEQGCTYHVMPGPDSLDAERPTDDTNRRATANPYIYLDKETKK